MSATMKRKLMTWAYSGIAATVGGIGTAVTSVFGGQIIGSLDFTPRQVGAIAIGGAVTALAAYLKNSPLPAITDDKA